MEKAGSFILIAVIITIIMTSNAFAAGVVGTPHDMTAITSLQNAGTCSSCHIPHKAAGDARLWSSDNTGFTGAPSSKGLIGTLCAACHTTVGIYAGTLSYASYAEFYVYSSSGHDILTNAYVSNGTDDAEVIASQLPYSGADFEDGGSGIGVNLIQCTSCHNVHDNETNRPFLRVNIRDLCIQCHATRYHNGTDWQTAQGALIGNWYGSATLGAGFGINNPGSHPVGLNVTGEMDSSMGGDSPIIDFVGTTFMQLFDDVDGSVTPAGGWGDGHGYWNVGRHTATLAATVPGLGNDGGVVCVSCHAIHGTVDDTNPAIDPVFSIEGFGASPWLYNPSNNLLALPQSSGAIRTDGTTPANGSYVGDPAIDGRNTLCETCHRGTALLEYNAAGAPTAYAGTYWPNPGRSAFTHPIDDAAKEYDDPTNGLVTAFPADWPNGGAAAGDPVPICESCHVAHPARAVFLGNSDVDTPINNPGVTSGSGQYILRATLTGATSSANALCEKCHTPTSMANFKHHPTGTMGQLATAIDVPWAATVAALEHGADGNIGDGNSYLTCSDCHTAHNWGNWDNGVSPDSLGGPAKAGMDPDWWPVQNGRDPSDLRANELANQQGISATCELCHYKLRGAHNPGLDFGVTPTQTSANEWGVAEPQFQKTGTGTHFLGNVNSSTHSSPIIWASGWIMPTGGTAVAFDATIDAWPNVNTILAGDIKQPWSRWGIAGEEGTHLVCESCHELEPDKNDSNSKNLVYYFKEGTDSGSSQNSDTSYLCEGCHSQDGPPGSHQTTGNYVDDTGFNLQTTLRCDDLDPVYVLLAPSAPTSAPEAGAYPLGGAGYSTFFAPDNLNCDGCHQVHDASSISMTYCVDAPEGNVEEGLDATFYSRGGANPPADGTSGLRHPQGNTLVADGKPDLNYTAFCEQCHWYSYDNCTDAP